MLENNMGSACLLVLKIRNIAFDLNAKTNHWCFWEIGDYFSQQEDLSDAY